MALVLVLLVTFNSACNKNGVFTGPKIYLLTDLKAGTVYTYTYNTDGTVSTVTENTGKTTYTYNTSTSPHTVLVDNYNFSGIISSAYTYFLNSNNVADSDQGQYTSANQSDTFLYDNNNQLTVWKHYILNNLATTYTYTNTNKNVTQLVTVSGAVTTYDDYSYLPSNSNTIGVQDKGQYYLGISSNNLVAQDVKLNSQYDTTDIITYRYYYDSNSRVDTMASYHRNGVLIDSMAFTYY